MLRAYINNRLQVNLLLDEFWLVELSINEEFIMRIKHQLQFILEIF